MSAPPLGGRTSPRIGESFGGARILNPSGPMTVVVWMLLFGMSVTTDSPGCCFLECKSSTAPAFVIRAAAPPMSIVS